MSSREDIEIECPKCGESQQVVVWRSINVTLNPELLDALFDNKINAFVCVACGHQALLDVPLMYHDMDRKYAVSYYPFKNLDDKGFFDQFTPNGKLKIEFPPQFSKWMTRENYLEDSHVVFDLNEMKRYIVFRGQLHDLSISKPKG